MKTIGILQPSYIPWIGYFDQINKCDVFVLYDDVQYDKNGWRNRNKIKTANGPVWLTIPVLTKGKPDQKLCDIKIDNKYNWREKHIKTIKMAYAKAPFAEDYIPEFEQILQEDWELLIDVNLAVLNLLLAWLNINTPIHLSSRQHIEGEKSEKILRFCEKFGATNYLSGDKARDYLDTELFASKNITVNWHSYQHPTYPQRYGEFLGYLSVLDLIFNVGKKSKEIF